MRPIARYVIVVLPLVVLVAGGCREPDVPVAPGVVGTLVIDSDPQGASILVNGEDTGLVTPDTLHDLTVGEDTILTRLVRNGLEYGFRLPVRSASSDEVVEVKGPLLLQCLSSACFEDSLEEHEPNDMRMVTSALGALLYTAGAGEGLRWPATTANNYVSIGAPVLAGIRSEVGDTVALGPYDLDYLVGRPAPSVETTNGRYTMTQTAWVLPSGGSPAGTIRGIEIDQTLIGDAAVDGVVLLRLVYRNITNDPLYQVFDGTLEAAGETLESVYIGFVLDADVGTATSEVSDDRVSYLPDRDLALIYDGDLATSEFEGGWDVRPGVVGVRMLEAPEGTAVRMNGWPIEADWAAGSASEPTGLRWLSATQTVLSNHADERIGYAPETTDDYRASVSAGELTLAPGDSAAITVALLVAPPAEGTFTSGEDLEPGDPMDAERPLHEVLAELIDRADAAETLLPIDGD
ncbi:MAG: PEGA domain-containing protein [Gemmatimonadota bacterium]